MDARFDGRSPGGDGVADILQALTDVGVDHVEGPHQALFTQQSIAAALVDRQAGLICASPAFIAAQVAGAVLGTLVFGWLFREAPTR